jgi:hypothetical protein
VQAPQEGLHVPGMGVASLEYYVEMTPEALESLTPEERHRIYGMLGLRATITMDGTLEVSGTFNDGDILCGLETRYSML